MNLKVKLESLAVDAGTDDELGDDGNDSRGLTPERGDEVEASTTYRVQKVEGEYAYLVTLTVNGESVDSDTSDDVEDDELEAMLKEEEDKYLD